MITNKAAQQALNGVTAMENELCFCHDEDCEGYHPDHGPATHVITFVTPDGALDRAENSEYLGWPWGAGGDLVNALDYPQTFPEVADQMVVIERATGVWRVASSYL